MVSILAVGVGLDLDPWDWFWIGLWAPGLLLDILVLGVCILDWFWIGSGQEFALKSSSRKRCSWQKAKEKFHEGFRANFTKRNLMRVLGRILSGTTGLVSVVVGHYWINFGEGRIGFGLVSGGPGALLDWIHFERNTTGLDALLMHYWIGYIP